MTFSVTLTIQISGQEENVNTPKTSNSEKGDVKRPEDYMFSERQTSRHMVEGDPKRGLIR